MKRLLGSTGAKLLAGVLLFASALALALSIVSGVVLTEFSALRGDGEQLRARLLRAAVSNQMSEAENYYYTQRSAETAGAEEASEYDDSLDYYKNRFAPEQTNFFFVAETASGRELLRTGSAEDAIVLDRRTVYPDSTGTVWEERIFDTRKQAEDYLAEMNEKYPDAANIYEYSIDEIYTDADTPKYHVYLSYVEDFGEAVTITGYLPQTLTVHDEFYYVSRITSLLLAVRSHLVVLYVVLSALSLVLLVFLLCGAGRKPDGSVRLRWVDRMPLELYLFLLTALGGILAAIADEIMSQENYLVNAAAVAAAGAGILLLCLGALMSLAARIKAGKWWRGTLCYQILHLLWRAARWLACNLSLYWKFALGWGAISLAELVALANSTYSGLIVWVLEKLALTPLLLLVVVNMRRLQTAGEELAAGHLSYQVPLAHMLPAFRRHGEQLNSLGLGMQRAVDERMKSERMKTELITNVSHDIKTPLTSIISYVDLLKKQDLPAGCVQEYVNVLDRQSRRLKKLTDDLVEASKASTGNLPVHLEPTDVNVLLEQVAGEYGERMEKAGLTLVTEPAPENPVIQADGRLIWRVLENILGNACKYALPGTRVYFSASLLGDKLSICVKNISRAPLNISSDELMERFVRGDSARHSEGSGLGLSISRSLTELQHGFFNILIDGDLFKAVLVFPAVPPTADPPQDDPAPEA